MDKSDKTLTAVVLAVAALIAGIAWYDTTRDPEYPAPPFDPDRVACGAYYAAPNTFAAKTDAAVMSPVGQKAIAATDPAIVAAGKALQEAFIPPAPGEQSSLFLRVDQASVDLGKACSARFGPEPR